MALSREELERLFVQADEAGNEEDARAFLAELDNLAAPKQRRPQELQNAMMRNEPGAKEEWDARAKAAGAEQVYNPIEGQRPTDLRVEGFGRSINSTKEGIGQLLGITPQSQIDESARIDAPLMNNVHGQIGNIAGITTQMLVPGTAIARGGMLAPKVAAMSGASRFGLGLLGASAENAAFTGIQPVVSGDTRMGNMGEAALWGAGGKAAQSGVGLLARGGSGAVSNVMKNLQEEAAKRGINIGVPELTNNQMIQTVSNQLGRLPFGGGTKRIADNRAAFNQATAKTFGENADAINDDVYSAAKTRLSANYDKIKANNPLPLNKTLVDELSALQKDAQMKGGREAGEIIKGWTKALAGKADKSGKVDGAAFKALDSELGAQMKSGGPNSIWLGQLRDSLRKNWNDAVIARGNAGDIKLLAETNSQYGALKTIRDLVSDDGISPQGLMARVRSNNAGKERMASGTAGELGELAKIGQKMKAPPNSGTADRGLVNLAALGAAGAGGSYAGSQGWISPELALLVGGGLLGNRALNSKAASNYFVKGMNPTAQGLLKGAAKPLPYVLPAIAATSAAAEPKKKKKKKD